MAGAELSESGLSRRRAQRFKDKGARRDHVQELARRAEKRRERFEAKRKHDEQDPPGRHRDRGRRRRRDRGPSFEGCVSLMRGYDKLRGER